MNKEELLARARKPAQDAMIVHPFYRGKIQVVPKCAINSPDDFAIYYTPGVAEPCKAIKTNKDKVYELTNKWNTVAVVSDGTRILGLGDIGPEASLPVMEGKALLFKYLGGVDAFPICLDTKDPEEIITAVKWLQPSFGGINLEDIASPKCFYILKKLRAEMDIPVWHDDQQGTAAVILAGLINSLKLTGKKLDKVSIAMIGAGAANIAISKLLFAAGAKLESYLIVDSEGILHPKREDLKTKRDKYIDKWKLCQITNIERRIGGIAEALRGADVCIALSKPGPSIIRPEWIKDMAKDAIVFSCANPIPEIWPWEAKEAGAKIVATGRSDFPNQVNNSLGFPGIFRGTLDVGARAITDDMCIAAAYSLADTAESRGITEDNIIPTMWETEAYINEAIAVAMKAQEQGVARISRSQEELHKSAEAMIKSAQRMAALLIKEGLIASAPQQTYKPIAR